MIFDTNYKNQVRQTLKLSINEYLVALFISQQMLNPESAVAGWCFTSKQMIAKYLDLSQRTVFDILKKLHSKGLIEKIEKTKFVRTTQKFYDCQNCIPSAQTAQDVQNLHSFSKEKESTKEREYINIPVSSKQDDVPPKRVSSCPLNNPTNPLKEKWPKGHLECVEYVTSYKFVNKGKQFKFLHQMLRAGLDFPDIDKITRRVKSKGFYKDNGWDFATLASEADRSSNASP